MKIKQYLINEAGQYFKSQADGSWWRYYHSDRPNKLIGSWENIPKKLQPYLMDRPFPDCYRYPNKFVWWDYATGEIICTYYGRTMADCKSDMLKKHIWAYDDLGVKVTCIPVMKNRGVDAHDIR